MDNKIAVVLVEAATAAVSWLVDKVKHHDTKLDESALKAIAIAAAQAAITRASLELERRGFVVAIDTLALATQQAIEAIHKAESAPSLPRILDGVQFEQMPADWHPDPEPTK